MLTEKPTPGQPSTFNFVRQSGGKGAFARLKLAVEPASANRVEVLIPLERLDPILRSDWGPVVPEWRDAAVAGMWEAVAFMTLMTGQLWLVQLYDVIGTDVDTNPTIARYAGSLAVVKGVYGVDLKAPSNPHDHKWIVDYARLSNEKKPER